MSQIAPWCSLCDGPHEPCERADLRYDCLTCFRPIEEFDEVEVDGEFYHPDCTPEPPDWLQG